MKIGIFDSGLGGLIIAKAIRKAMPEYDYVYLGDTKRVPYGNRSYESVYEFTKEGVDYLFKKENCQIIVIACNTSSARALRYIQKEYISKHHPGKKVLGVLIPAAEMASRFNKIGILATRGTVASKTFLIEIKKLNKAVKVFQNPAPMLVPLAEEGEKDLSLQFLKKYLQPLEKKNIDALVLGCTHYPIFKKEIRNLVSSKIKVISQDEIVPLKLKNYLIRHPEIKKKLTKKRTAKILVTDITQTVGELTKKWFGGNIKLELVNFEKS